MLTIRKETNFNSDYRSTIESFKRGGYVVPAYNRLKLAQLSEVDSVHTRALKFKSGVVRGYYFEDEEKVPQNIRFLMGTLRDNKGMKISFVQFIKNLLMDYNTFGEAIIELPRLGSQIGTFFNFNPKNLFVNKDRTSYKEFLYSGFVNYSEGVTFYPLNAAPIGGRELTIFGDRSLLDDFYSTPCYSGALKEITIKETIAVSDLDWLENSNLLESFLLASGINSSTADELIKKLREAKLQAAAGKLGLVHIEGGEGSKLELSSIPTKEMFDFTFKKDSANIEILAAHGVDKDIINVEKGAGGLSTTQKMGALNLFLELETMPLIARVELFLDNLFKEVDPTYNTNIKLQTFRAVDEDKKSQQGLKEVMTIEKYIDMGSLVLYNEYRKKNNQVELTTEEWVKMVNKGGGDES